MPGVCCLRVGNWNSPHIEAAHPRQWCRPSLAGWECPCSQGLYVVGYRPFAPGLSQALSVGGYWLENKGRDQMPQLPTSPVDHCQAGSLLTMYLLLESAPEPSHVHHQAGGGQHRASKGASGQGLTSQAGPAAGGPHHSHPLGGCRPHAE